VLGVAAVWLLYACSQTLGGCTRAFGEGGLQQLVLPTRTNSRASVVLHARRPEWEDGGIISCIPPRFTPTLLFQTTPFGLLTSPQNSTHHISSHPRGRHTNLNTVPGGRAKLISERDGECVCACERETGNETYHPTDNNLMVLLLCFPRSNYMGVLPSFGRNLLKSMSLKFCVHTIWT
jgi:hypothetical protein